jgi:1,4-dihydroxy-2-naphthoyl-CoA synthase
VEEAMMKLRAAVLVLTLAMVSSACAGGWNTVAGTREPAPSSRPHRVRLRMREAPTLVLEHARVFPDSVVETEIVDGRAVRVRSIPMSDVYRVETWESGGGRTAALVAVLTASTAAVFYVLATVVASEVT